jgi:hypothetical protein
MQLAGEPPGRPGPRDVIIFDPQGGITEPVNGGV